MYISYYQNLPLIGKSLQLKGAAEATLRQKNKHPVSSAEKFK